MSFKAGHGLGGPGFNGVRRGDDPHGFAGHGQEDGGLALPGQLVLVGGEGFGGDALAGEKGQVSQEDLLALDPGLDPQARHGLEILHPGQGQILRLSGVGDGLGQGVLRFFLQGRGLGQDCVGAPALPGVDVGHLGGAPGEGAGLVEDHGGEAVGPLQGFAAPEQDAQFGAPARAHHDRGGGGQPHGAGAGDDEHRHHADDGPAEGGRRPPEVPDQKGQGRQAHDHRARRSPPPGPPGARWGPCWSGPPPPAG